MLSGLRSTWMQSGLSSLSSPMRKRRPSQAGSGEEAICHEVRRRRSARPPQATSFILCSSLLSLRVWGEVELNVDLWSGPNPCPRPTPSFAGPSVTLWLPPAPFLFPK